MSSISASRSDPLPLARDRFDRAWHTVLTFQGPHIFAILRALWYKANVSTRERNGTPSFFLPLAVAASDLTGGKPKERRKRDGMRPYELVFIVAPQQDDEKVQAQIDTVTKRIAGYGGEVTKLSIWGKLKLAYPIKKFREGHYVVVQMQMPAEAVKQLDRDLLISENVIRHLIVRLDEE